MRDYSIIPTTELEKIYQFTKDEITDKLELYRKNPSDELSENIEGLIEVTSNIKLELAKR